MANQMGTFEKIFCKIMWKLFFVVVDGNNLQTPKMIIIINIIITIIAFNLAPFSFGIPSSFHFVFPHWKQMLNYNFMKYHKIRAYFLLSFFKNLYLSYLLQVQVDFVAFSSTLMKIKWWMKKSTKSEYKHKLRKVPIESSLENNSSKFVQ